MPKRHLENSRSVPFQALFNLELSVCSVSTNKPDNKQSLCTNAVVRSDLKLSADLVSFNTKCSFEPSIGPVSVIETSTNPTSVNTTDLTCQYILYQPINLFVNNLPVHFPSMSLILNSPLQPLSVPLIVSYLPIRLTMNSQFAQLQSNEQFGQSVYPASVNELFANSIPIHAPNCELLV